MKINLDLNDPHMLFDCEEVEATKAQLVTPKHAKKGRKPLPRPLPKVSDNYGLKEEMLIVYYIDAYHIQCRY